jgi:hypothetical protein
MLQMREAKEIGGVGALESVETTADITVYL